MYKTLIVLILAVILLSWNFIFTSEKKIDLTDQAKVLQGLSLVLKYKIAVIKYWNEKGTLPDSVAVERELKLEPLDFSKSLVKQVEVSKDEPGVITVIFMNKPHINVKQDINDRKVMLKPVVVDNKLDWVCRSDLGKDLLPKRCMPLN